MYSKLNNFLHKSSTLGKGLLAVGVVGFVGYKLTDGKINKDISRYGCYGRPKKICSNEKLK